MDKETKDTLKDVWGTVMQHDRDMSVVKSSLVELKQRLDRVEKHSNMPEASRSYPTPENPDLRPKGAMLKEVEPFEQRYSKPGALSRFYGPFEMNEQDFRWGETSPGAEERAKNREAGYDYAMSKVKKAIEKFKDGAGDYSWIWDVFEEEVGL